MTSDHEVKELLSPSDHAQRHYEQGDLVIKPSEDEELRNEVDA